MPLSEDEQRILHQIEQQFYESDPEFARGVSQSSLYRHAFRNIKWAVLAMLAALAFLVAMLALNVVVLSFVGFIGMLAAAFVIESNGRKLGRAGWQEMTESVRSGRIRASFGGAGTKVRKRLQRDDEN
jgi:hypothetical protein